MNNEEAAKMFVDAIQTIGSKPENLKNLELYLSHHFDKWLERFANTPENMAVDFSEFARMEI